MLIKMDELIHFGMQIEERGFNFYQGMAVGTEDTEVKKVFQFLADEEEKHYNVLTKCLLR